MKEHARIDFVRSLTSVFDLRLNDIKFRNEEPSDKLFNFSKLFGPSFLNVMLGFEEASIGFRNPPEEQKIIEICGKFSQIMFTNSFRSIAFNVREHCQSASDLRGFLENLVSTAPTGFKDLLTGRGAYYTLQFPQHSLTGSVTVTNSLYVQNGLFLAVDFYLQPFEGSLQQAFETARDAYGVILDSLNLKMEKE